MFMAAQEGHIEVVKFLESKGADKDAKNNVSDERQMHALFLMLLLLMLCVGALACSLLS